MVQLDWLAKLSRGSSSVLGVYCFRVFLPGTVHNSQSVMISFERSDAMLHIVSYPTVPVTYSNCRTNSYSYECSQWDLTRELPYRSTFCSSDCHFSPFTKELEYSDLSSCFTVFQSVVRQYSMIWSHLCVPVHAMNNTGLELISGHITRKIIIPKSKIMVSCNKGTIWWVRNTIEGPWHCTRIVSKVWLRRHRMIDACQCEVIFAQYEERRHSPMTGALYDEPKALKSDRRTIGWTEGTIEWPSPCRMNKRHYWASLALKVQYRHNKETLEQCNGKNLYKVNGEVLDLIRVKLGM